MNIIKRTTRTTLISYLLAMLAIPMFLAVANVAAQERGTTRDKAVLVESNEVKDELDGSGDSYWYKFVAGPGTVKITLEVEANETNAGATLDVFSVGTRPIVSNVLAQGVDKGSESVERTFKLTKQQTITVRIKGIKYGDNGGTGSYKITVDSGGEKKVNADN